MDHLVTARFGKLAGDSAWIEWDDLTGGMPRRFSTRHRQFNPGKF
jgi:hypothetical protein